MCSASGGIFKKSALRKMQRRFFYDKIYAELKEKGYATRA
jgi:hypothetical protein